MNVSGVGVAGERELGLFVMWSQARSAQDRILADIQANFEVHRAYEVRWSPDCITANYARFYRGRAQPPYRAAFEEQKGRGPFVLVTVVDDAPRYEERPTLKGVRPVNVRFFDAKMRYRDWVGGKMRVHATDSAAEARRDLTLLLGRDAERYLQEHATPWDGEIRRLERDLPGARGWPSRAQLQDVLRGAANYVALSGVQTAGPLILLTDDYPELVRVANARPRLGQLPRWGGDFAVHVARADLRFQIRFVGDGYLDADWARALLERRVERPGDFHRLAPDDARDFQAYHALVHRGAGARPERSDVDARLERLGALYTLPRDPTVPFDYAALDLPSPGLRHAQALLRGALWRIRHRLHRPLSAAWWRIREPLRRRVGWLRHLRTPLGTQRAG